MSPLLWNPFPAACAIRSYDAEGQFVSESPIEIPDGNFGKSVLRIQAPLLQSSGL